MSWIVAKMQWVMLVSGALTCTMLYAAVAPRAAMHSTFGETLEGPAAELVVRSWGSLIALVGGMLIYGAYDQRSRPVILTVAGLGKLIFIGLVVAQGARYLSQQAGVAVVCDLVMVALFATYLVAIRQGRTIG